MKSGQLALLTFFVVAVIIGVGRFVLMPLGWAIIALAMFVFVVGLGVVKDKGWLGILINERNVMSLSRVQMILWTILILSAFVTIALQRVSRADKPLDIAIPQILWALMGISTTSLVGSPLLKSPKQSKTPTRNAVARLYMHDSKNSLRMKTESNEGRNVTIDEVAARSDIQAFKSEHADGTLYVRPKNEPAQFSDIFSGDEITNYDLPDVAKVQMFFFTLVGVVSYAVLLWTVMSTNATSPEKLSAFPDLSEGLVALLGISHAGYLVNTAVDHTPTQPG